MKFYIGALLLREIERSNSPKMKFDIGGFLLWRERQRERYRERVRETERE
jgi:hypothetical protein